MEYDLSYINLFLYMAVIELVVDYWWNHHRKMEKVGSTPTLRIQETGSGIGLLEIGVE